jgi:epoxide hydrolase-like predicted phosphatase
VGIQAILFDFGGVFTPSPFDTIRMAAEELGIEGEVAFALCFGPYDEDTDHAWHRLERGELALEDARAELIALAKDAGHDMDPFTLLTRMAGEDEQREEVVARARRLRSEGYRTAVVTNNIKEFGDGWRRMVPVDELFDIIIDSSAVGMRKPDPRIYHLTLETLGGVTPDAAVLVDDALGNITAARALGMHGIHVSSDRVAAMDELEALLAAGAGR